MKWGGLILALVVLGALAGVLDWSEHRNPAEETPPAGTTQVILKANDITRLTIRQTMPVMIDKTQGKWQITQPAPYPADQETVAGVLSTLSGLNADRVVDNKATDRKQYGLDPAVVEIDITEKNGATQQLLLGDATPVGGDVYAAVAGDPRVFTIASSSKTSLDKSLNDLRDKSLLSADKVSRVELLKKAEEIEFDRTKDGWQIVKPKQAPADDFAVNELVRSLVDARMDLNTTGDPAVGFARGSAVATAKLTGDSGVQRLEVRKDKNDYYAKSSQVAGAFKVDSALGQAMDKKLDDFLSKTK